MHLLKPDGRISPPSNALPPDFPTGFARFLQKQIQKQKSRRKAGIFKILRQRRSGSAA
jgi:hypothetical protein